MQQFLLFSTKMHDDISSTPALQFTHFPKMFPPIDPYETTCDATSEV